MSLVNDTFFAPYNFDGYPASKGVMHFVQPLFNGAAEDTNANFLVKFGRNILGEKIPPTILAYNISNLIGIFGQYPVASDRAPSILFAVLFALVGVLHFIIFSINFSRGHFFWISFVWGLNCVLQLIGFALRAEWSKDVAQPSIGLTSDFFLIIPSIVFVSFDLILAQRLFTWRHPVGGSRRLFWNIMIGMYIVVFFLVVITVLASYVHYLDFLGNIAWQKWRKVNMATGVLVILYSLTSMILIALSYVFQPTARDENLYTYQPWWIESFNTFYFVKRGAAQEAAESFMKRNHNHRHATRVIAATHHHYNMVEGLTNQRGNLSHNTSTGLIIITTVLIFIGAMGRCVVLFQNKIDRHMSAAGSRIFMYVAWGAFEFLINVLYIVGRVDLRFYRPDRLPKEVREIITAEQSYYPSANESDSSSGRNSFSSASEKSYEAPPSSLPYPRNSSDLREDEHDEDDHTSNFYF